MPEFTLSIAKMKTGGLIRERFNYNCETQKLEFLNEDDVLMQMEGTAQIDTLWLGSYRLVPYQGHMICVKEQFGKNILFVDYKVKKVEKGSIGAYGIRTHNNVQSFDRRSYDRIAAPAGVVPTHSGEPYVNLDKDSEDLTKVYGISVRNTYVIEINGKKKAFKDQKSLLKVLPDKTELIDNYLRENKVNFRNADEVLALIKAII